MNELITYNGGAIFSYGSVLCLENISSVKARYRPRGWPLWLGKQPTAWWKI